jgi:uncharacterized protein YegL
MALNQDFTYVGVLVDVSGSMQTLNPEKTSEELTNLIRDQVGGKVLVTMSKFDDQYETCFTEKNASDVTITAQDIQPRGGTALFYALSHFIDQIGSRLDAMTEEKPGKVVIIVLTDGAENASEGIYSGESGRNLVREKITHQRDKYSWIFYFLGTNFDAVTFGKGLGIDHNTCINYGNSAVGCANVIRSTSHALNRARFAPSAAAATALSSYTSAERNVSLQK